MNRHCPRLVAAIIMTLAAVSAHATTCAAESPAQRVALLELYTSEGCNSCPPTDRWVSGLPARGHTPASVVTLAFHVDYWNYLGWRDPFSQPQFSERQKAASVRNRARVVYTPQLLLNGRDYRRGSVFDDLGERVNALTRAPAQAAIRLRLDTSDSNALVVAGSATVAGAAARSRAQVYVALYENDLSNDITAGENRGRRLRHDFVVRELAGPIAVDTGGEARWHQRFTLDPRWKAGDLYVAAFVQDERSGDVLQALATPYCR